MIPDKDDGIVVFFEAEAPMIHGLKGDVQAEERDSDDENRVEPVDKWLEQINKRFDEQRSDVEAFYQALRADYRSLYDFFKAQGDKMDARFDQLEAELRTAFDELQAAITALTPRGRRTSGRRRR